MHKFIVSWVCGSDSMLISRMVLLIIGLFSVMIGFHETPILVFGSALLLAAGATTFWTQPSSWYMGIRARLNAGEFSFPEDAAPFHGTRVWILAAEGHEVYVRWETCSPVGSLGLWSLKVNVDGDSMSLCAGETFLLHRKLRKAFIQQRVRNAADPVSKILFNK